MASTRLRYWLFCVALLIGLCCVAPAAMAAPAANLRVAKVTALSGEVKVKKAGGEKSLAAFKNMGLTEGDTIITGKAASLTLELDEFEEVRIGENSHVLISELRVALDENSEQTTFNLLAGGLWSNIRKQLNLDSRYQIKTANAVMGVRGTMWYVGQHDGRTDVAVLEGTVVATPSLSTTQPQPGFEPPTFSLTAGQQVSLDMPPLQYEDFVVQPLIPESFDMLLLQMIDQLSDTRPDLVPPGLALQVQQQISQIQPPPPPPAPPAPLIIFDPVVIPPQMGGGQDVPTPQLPVLRLPSIGDRVVAAGGTVLVDATPAGAPLNISVSPTASNADGLEIWTEHVHSAGAWILWITGRQVGTYTVTVTASGSGYIPDSKAFTVRVVNAPTVTGLEIAGDPYVGEEVWVEYQYSDEDEDAESGTTYQWQRAATADAPESGWSAISGATRDAYVPTAQDEGKWLRCVVIPKDGIVYGAPVTSNAIGGVGDERDVYDFPTIGDITVARNGVIRIPLPKTPGFLQDSYSYQAGFASGYSADPSIAQVSVGSIGHSYYLFIEGAQDNTEDVKETNVSIIVRQRPSDEEPTSPLSYKTTRVRFRVTVIKHGEQLPWVDPATFRITGAAQPGSTLTASYEFNDPQGHAEGNGLFTWYRYDEEDGQGELIYGANGKTYTLTSDDVGHYIRVGLNPCDEFGFGGETVGSSVFGPVLASAANQPTDVRIEALTPAAGVLVNAEYTYESQQPTGEVEVVHRWYSGSADPDANREQIQGADSERYLPTEEDIGHYLWYSVQVIAPELSTEVFSEMIGPITNYQGTTLQLLSVAPSWQGDVLTWTPVKSALGYEIQLFTSSEAPYPWIARHVFGNKDEYDFAELLQMGDLREGNAEYYAAVKAMGCGIVGDSPLSEFALSNHRGKVAPTVIGIGFEDGGETGGPEDFRISFTGAESSCVAQYRVLLVPQSGGNQAPGITLADANVLPDSASTSVNYKGPGTYQVALSAEQTDVYGMPIVEKVQYIPCVLSVSNGGSSLNSLSMAESTVQTLPGQGGDASRLRFVQAVTNGDGDFTLTFNSEIQIDDALSFSDFEIIPYALTELGWVQQEALEFAESSILSSGVWYQISLGNLREDWRSSFPDGCAVRYSVMLKESARSLISSIDEYPWEGPYSRYTAICDNVAASPVVDSTEVGFDRVIVHFADTPYEDRLQLTGVVQDGEVGRTVKLVTKVDCQSAIPHSDGLNSIIARADGSLEISLPDARLGQYESIEIGLGEVADGRNRSRDNWCLEINDNGTVWGVIWHNYSN